MITDSWKTFFLFHSLLLYQSAISAFYYYMKFIFSSLFLPFSSCLILPIFSLSSYSLLYPSLLCFFSLVIMSYSSYLILSLLFSSLLNIFFLYSILFTRLFSFFSFFTLISHFLFFHYTVCCWATKTFRHDNYSFCNASQSWFSKSTVGKDNNVSAVQYSAVQCSAVHSSMPQ